MKKNKIMRLLSISIVVPIAMIFGMIAAWNHLSDYARILKANWNFSLPSSSSYQEIYSQDSGASFLGDGIRYHIFSYKEASRIDEMVSWQTTEQSTRYYDSYSQAAEEWLNAIEVPLEERPNYGECSYWYQIQDDNSEMIVFWDKYQCRLSIVESFL